MCGIFNKHKGQFIKVIEVINGYHYEVLDSDKQRIANCSYCFVDEHLELINQTTNQSTMNLTEKFALAFKQEPEKSFRKAGITNGDDFLTEEGQNIFLSWLLKKHGEELMKEVVDDLLKDEEKAA